MGTTKGTPMNAPSVVKRITLMAIPVLVIGLVATWLLTAPMREAAYDRDMAAKVLADPNAGYTGSEAQNWAARRMIDGNDTYSQHDEHMYRTQYQMPQHPTNECFDEDVLSQEGGLKGCLNRVETASFGWWMSAYCFTEKGMSRYGADKGFKLTDEGFSLAWANLAYCVGVSTQTGRDAQFERLLKEYTSLVSAATVQLRSEINAQAFPTQRARAEAIAKVTCYKPNTSNRDAYVNWDTASKVFSELGFDKASTDSLWYDAEQSTSKRADSPFGAIAQYVCSQ